MNRIRQAVEKIKNLCSELMLYVVGKAAKNRIDFLETVEEGEEVVGTTKSSWEGVIFILIIAVTVFAQWMVMDVLTIHVIPKTVVVLFIVWTQVKVITMNLKHRPMMMGNSI